MDERERPANELLYDTEAALRLVDKALDEICGPPETDLPEAGLEVHTAALSLVRQPAPSTSPPPAAAPHPAAAELIDILEDVRLGRALLDRARTRRGLLAQGGATGAACHAIGNQYLDGASHLLAELEQRLVAVAEMLRRDAGPGTRDAASR